MNLLRQLWGVAMSQGVNPFKKIAVLTGLMMFIGGAEISSAATITVFNNDAAGFAAAAGSLQTEDFSDTTLLPALSVTSNVGSITGGVWHDQLSPSQQTTTWSFSGPITAFGGNWNTGTPQAGISFTLTFLDNTTQLVPVQLPNNFTGQFFGFVSDTPFKSVL